MNNTISTTTYTRYYATLEKYNISGATFIGAIIALTNGEEYTDGNLLDVCIIDGITYLGIDDDLLLTRHPDGHIESHACYPDCD